MNELMRSTQISVCIGEISNNNGGTSRITESFIPRRLQGRKNWYLLSFDGVEDKVAADEISNVVIQLTDRYKILLLPYDLRYAEMPIFQLT